MHHTTYIASYDALFIGASIIFSLIGSFAALISGMHIPTSRGAARVRWIFTSALSLGGGAIWSMHFMGMLAYHIDHDIGYDLTRTCASLAIAVASSMIGLRLVATNPDSALRLATGGVITGLGVTAMHYTGMAAMRTGGPIYYDHLLVALSVGIAVVAALAAMWIAFRVRSTRSALVASTVMAGAVCGMHYTAMAATRVAVNNQPSVGGTDPMVLGFVVLVIAFIILTAVIVMSLGGVSDAGAFALAAAGPGRSGPTAPGRAGQHSQSTRPGRAGRPVSRPGGTR